jgi:hypothetical protein
LVELEMKLEEREEGEGEKREELAYFSFSQNEFI